MIKLDCYLGVDSKEMWGINRFKLETFANMRDKELDKRKITYQIPKNPRILRRLANFLDFISLSPLEVIKQRRKDAVAFIMSHSEAYLLNYFKFSKSVVLCYDVLPIQFKLTGWMSRAKINFAYRGMIKADRIITIAESVKDDIVKHLNYPAERIDVIYGGVDPVRYKILKGNLSHIKRKYGVPDNKKVVLFLASEEPRKNFPVVLRAFAKLKKRLPDIVLLKVGKARKAGVRKQNLDLINRLGISQDVVFSGYAPEEDVPGIYNVADVVAFPTFYEGAISLPLIEAMACGCPVISTRHVTETIGNSPAMMENVTDPDELENLMYEVLTDKNFRLRIINHGLDQSKKFHWEKTGKSVVDIFKRLATE